MMDVPTSGQAVIVRQRHYVVLDVSQSTLQQDSVSSTSVNPRSLLRLSSLEDDGLGEEIQVIWEVEPGVTSYEKLGLPRPTLFDSPQRLDAFLNAVRWGAVSSADVKSLQAPFRSGIEIEDYQLDPAVRALQMPRVNLLIADDVGLGKTIEAGLVAQELILRHRVRTILVVCPASLLYQWRDQMRDKFGLEFRIIDSALMKDLRRSRGLHVNPWTHFPRLITSIDFLKRERPLRLFKEILPSQGIPTYPRTFDLLILDEAHNVAPSGMGAYAIDSMRTQAIRAVSPHFEHKLFLSATPHNGYKESFSSLLELLDNQRFARGVEPDKTQLGAVMVRRMKSELKGWDGGPRFALRDVQPLRVAYTSKEREVHSKLQQYTKSRQEHAKDGQEKFATDFVLKLLKKRLFSSPEAFRVTLGQHLKSLEGATKQANRFQKPSLQVLQRQVDSIAEDYGDDEAYETASSEATESTSRLFSPPSDIERALLNELTAYAEEASKVPDSKARELLDWLDKNIRPAGKWLRERVLIFTEYRATQKWLMGILAHRGFTEAGRLEIIFGGMDVDERERIKAAFQTDPSVAPVRILLATDAASEGVDLQNHCSKLIHYEIPWNPNRMEQRNGRLDRHGQKAPKVDVFHFVGKDFEKNLDAPPASKEDLDGDLEFLCRAALKVENIREDLGKVGSVIAQQVEEAMLGRRRSLDTGEAERSGAAVKKLLKFERDLRAQVEKLHQKLTDSQRDLNISPFNVEDVVKVGLALAQQPPLIEARVSGIWPDPTGQRKSCPVFHLPALSGSWGECAQGLRHPHTQEIRPIVFDENLARGRDDVVLAHLNHRLVQMCQRLLRAEIWSQEETKGLNRTAARVVPDSALAYPAAIAYGRLVILGADNHRLHEEIFTAGVLLKDGKAHRMNVTETDGVLATITSREPSPQVKDRLKGMWPAIEAPLQAALEARMKDRERSLQKFLDERALEEADKIEAILKQLAFSIEEELNEPDTYQTTLFDLLNTDERSQFERNKDFLRHRLAKIPEEIKAEQEHIIRRFTDPTARLFPVAVTFLVPEKHAGLEGGVR